MSSILPESELLRRAAAWICDLRAAKPEKQLHACLDEAGMRFNLSPLDQQKLAALFARDESMCGESSAGRQS